MVWGLLLRTNSHRVIFVFTLILSGIVINSCDFETKEFISVYIVNHTEETILVYTGANILFFELPAAIITSGNIQPVMAEKGQSISIYGKDTNINYGSRSFFLETQWEIR